MQEIGILKSVCMATYNGEAFVRQQLESILFQLGPNDELIVVDDHSTDGTIGVVVDLNDSRIKVFRNERNLGVLRSFERAISLAKGGIIFLSDQDDIWSHEKVVRVMSVFEKYSDVTLVLSDARIIDKEGHEIDKSFFSKRGAFKPGVFHNFIKNKYLGCVMAFKREMVNRILPFPVRIPQHDMWIGLINAVYGRAFYIDMPLVNYRRHGNNASSASSNKRSGIQKMIVWRWQLLKNLILRVGALYKR